MTTRSIKEWTGLKNPGKCLVKMPTLLLAREFLKNTERFLDLGTHGVLRFKQGKKLIVVHLEKHTGNLASQFRLRTKNAIR